MRTHVHLLFFLLVLLILLSSLFSLSKFIQSLAKGDFLSLPLFFLLFCRISFVFSSLSLSFSMTILCPPKMENKGKGCVGVCSVLRACISFRLCVCGLSKRAHRCRVTHTHTYTHSTLTHPCPLSLPLDACLPFPSSRSGTEQMNRPKRHRPQNKIHGKTGWRRSEKKERERKRKKTSPLFVLFSIVPFLPPPSLSFVILYWY